MATNKHAVFRNGQEERSCLMDLSQSIEPNSQQVNAEDLIASARTVTITSVEAGTSEQPVFVHLQEFPGRTYRPSKSMRRLMVSAWGPEASEYTGRRLTLVRNPDIRFGKDIVGGIEISSMSHIDKPLTVALTVSRGKRRNFTVQPLPAAARIEAVSAETVKEWVSALTAATDVAALQALWLDAVAEGVAKSPEVLAAKDRRKGELT